MSPPKKHANPVTAPQVEVVSYGKGIVKQVLCGDTIILYARSGCPPPEKLLTFLHVMAPKMAKRPVNGVGGTMDEPWAWDSREFLRQKLVGQEVTFSFSKPQNANREYGYVWLGSDKTGENIVETMVREGLVTVWRESVIGDDMKRLLELEDRAKAAGRGKWSRNKGSRADKIRDIKRVEENPAKIVKLYGCEPVRAIIEHVRDGSTVRALLLPDFHCITLMIAGIRCPGLQLDEDGKPNMSLKLPYCDEARFFVEKRLLQRDVQIVLESVSKGNFFGSILHPKGNIAEALLREGLAQCVDWSLAIMKSGADRLRAAENDAKEKRLRLWESYQPKEATLNTPQNTFTATVVEVINGDAINVKLEDGEIKRVFFSSIRPPRGDGGEDIKTLRRTKNFRPLYGIPFMLEAREFLRKPLIQKKVQCQLDYIHPTRDGLPAKYFYTVLLGEVNMAEALVAEGLATCCRYRQGDDQRSRAYDQLLVAENHAIKNKSGVHGKNIHRPQRVIDLTQDPSRIKTHYLPSWQRAECTDAVVDFVSSGARLRLYVPKDSCLVTLLLAGIVCPRASRPALKGLPAQEQEPYGDDALEFTRDHVLQRDVEVHIESAVGSSIVGWLWTDSNVNLAIALVEEGLAEVHTNAEKSQYFRELKEAEKRAQTAKRNIWANYEETEQCKAAVEQEKNDQPEMRRVRLQSVIITEITTELTFFAQSVEKGANLETLMSKLRLEFDSKPPIVGSYKFKRGDLCAAQFSQDKQWYRARVERLEGPRATVMYIDYGNKETLPFSCLAQLPKVYHKDFPYATEYALALVKLPPDDEDKDQAVCSFTADVLNRRVYLNVELKVSSGPNLATVYDPDTNVDFGKQLVADGLALADMRREHALVDLVKQYKAAQEAARTAHLAIWQYGDISQDDEPESR